MKKKSVNTTQRLGKKIFIAGKVYDLQVMDKDEVEVNGTMWHAVPVDDDSIEEGAKVKVVAIEGAKLPVKRVSER